MNNLWQYIVRWFGYYFSTKYNSVSNTIYNTEDKVNKIYTHTKEIKHKIDELEKSIKDIKYDQIESSLDFEPTKIVIPSDNSCIISIDLAQDEVFNIKAVCDESRIPVFISLLNYMDTTECKRKIIESITDPLVRKKVVSSIIDINNVSKLEQPLIKPSETFNKEKKANDF